MLLSNKTFNSSSSMVMDKPENRAKSPKVLFIYPPVRLSEKARVPPIGYMYMAAVLEEAGIDVEIIDINLLRIDLKTLFEMLQEREFDVIGIGGMTTVYYYMKMLSLELKKHYPEVPIIGGGSACSSTPKVALSNTGLDVVCIGEGEPIIVDLVQKLYAGMPLKDIEGIAYINESGEFEETTTRERLDNLSSLPFPAYHLVNMEEYLANNYAKYAATTELTDFAVSRGIDVERAKRPVFLYTKRGCPFGCTFCYRNFGRKVIYNSVDSVLEHMRFVANKYNTSHFIFGDELFNVSKGWVQEFCEKIIAGSERYVLSTGNGLRANCLDEASVKQMREAGFFRVSIGVESFYEPSLKEMKKNQSATEIVAAFDMLKKAGILVGHQVLLFGYKADGMEAMRENVKWLARLKMFDASFVIPCPYPGTVMYDEAKEKGLITDEESWLMELADKDVSDRVINLSGKSIEELNAIITWGRDHLKIKKIQNRYFVLGSLLGLLQVMGRKSFGVDIISSLMGLRGRLQSVSNRKVADEKQDNKYHMIHGHTPSTDDYHLLEEAMERLDHLAPAQALPVIQDIA